MKKTILEQNGFNIVTDMGVVYTDPFTGRFEREEIYRAEIIDILCEEQRKKEKNKKYNNDDWD